MKLGVEKSIYYFNEEGNNNTYKTIELALERSKELNINKILVFTRNGETALKIRKNNKDIDIIAVSFPYKQEFLLPGKNDNENKTVIPETSLSKTKEMLSKNNIKLLQGTMPLSEITIPGLKETKKQTIYYTLLLISGGLNLCVQSILMATDSGLLETGEEIIAMSADTAIVATGTNTHWLFHPIKGLEIREVICKPRYLSLIHKK